MITKSIILIVLVTFANFVTPRRRHFPQRIRQMQYYRNMAEFKPILAEPKLINPGPCDWKPSSVIPDTPSNFMSCSNNDKQLILPPRGIELPFGLGYSYVALPAVAEAFNEKMWDIKEVSEARIPFSPEFANIKIATPFCSEWDSLVKSIVL